MKKYVCDVCGYIYDEAAGDPDNGIEPGTAWEDVPEDFLCALCGVGEDQVSEGICRCGNGRAVWLRGYTARLS